MSALPLRSARPFRRGGVPQACNTRSESGRATRVVWPHKTSRMAACAAPGACTPRCTTRRFNKQVAGDMLLTNGPQKAEDNIAIHPKCVVAGAPRKLCSLKLGVSNSHEAAEERENEGWQRLLKG